ncbi:MAG TPA: hypothetical protein VEJ86_10335 [Candidatus Binataceae bacterium]|nr:hypothetical protein [Candidatus Binataceae bacterium]
MPNVTLALVKDLFFRSKLDAVAERASVEIAYASDLKSAASRAAELHPSLVVVDLSLGDTVEIATTIRAVAPSARLVGFASHVDLKPLRAARETGFELALSKSEFTAQLPQILGAGA